VIRALVRTALSATALLVSLVLLSRALLHASVLASLGWAVVLAVTVDATWRLRPVAATE
jgi:hypothetical protein